jgi:hypothetical protein
MTRHIINATTLSRDLSRILNKVHYQGQHFEIRRGREIIAKIIPTEARQRQVRGLQALLASLPHLDEDDIENFFNDLNKVRKNMPHEENPWD